jgi:hypothetical protein
LTSTTVKPSPRSAARKLKYASRGVSGSSLYSVMLPRTRGSTMNCWRRIADIARATPSMSALTKLSVTGSPRKRAALAVCAKAGGIGTEATTSAAATAVAPVLRGHALEDRCIVIRSK